ncbi:MAG: arsenate reductase family protein [Legionellaceae bacterium]|nr:arsenate reductase family protein [Legionellaceae bacterium]
MNPFILYHNPRCSKSRQTLEILQSHGVTPIIIEYLKSPLNLEQINQLRSHFDLKDFVRNSEPVFKKLYLTLADESKVLQAMVEEPILMQRPIVTSGNKAIIARPPEKVLALLSEK